jgi:hypothetical protein
MPGGRRGYNGRPDIREIEFLENYYGAKSPTKGNGMESAKAAGYSDSVAKKQWPRILNKYADTSFKSSARALGITKPRIAFTIRKVLDLDPEKFPKEVLAASRLFLALEGESTGEGGSNVTVNSTGPTMVIVGATAERIKALRNSTPQPTREQLEEESNRRSAERLEAFKRGELPELKRHSQAKRKVIDVEASVPDQHGDNDKPHRETET